jgi:LysR family hydrogen peroxide-inducible transcriptional activator
MTLQQLEYIVALDDARHFVKAAEKCFVTQATLSMMIKKLEEEWDVVLFDRGRVPVVPTPQGELILVQARQVLLASQRLKQVAENQDEEMVGELNLGVIPTVAPYFMPRVVPAFLKKYPQMKLNVREIQTDDIVELLVNQKLDAGVMALPVLRQGLMEWPLYKEDFVLYSSHATSTGKGKWATTKELDLNRLWLMEKGHCFRDQVIQFCDTQAKVSVHPQFQFSAGSLDTLVKMVNAYGGMTLLPQGATLNFTKKEMAMVKTFRNPVPQREVGLVLPDYPMKKKMLEVFSNEVKSLVPLWGR